MVEWLKRRDYDRNALGSKPNRAILLCPKESHITSLSPAWRSWQAVLNFNHISREVKNQNKKFQADRNILASPEADKVNC